MSSIHDLAPQLANARAFWLGYGTQSRREDRGLSLYRSGLDSPALNGVMRWTGDSLDDAVEEAGERLGDVPWMWWVGPDSRPESAERLLVRHAAVQTVSQPVMAVRIAEAKMPEVPLGLSIREVVDPVTTRFWAQTVASVYGVRKHQIEDRVALEFRRSGNITRFAGYFGGRVVATASLFDEHAVAGIFTVATAEGFRRRGFGAAMTAAVMQAGHERGLNIATLQSSPQGEPLYLRMGFQHVAEYRLFTLPAPRTTGYR